MRSTCRSAYPVGTCICAALSAAFPLFGQSERGAVPRTSHDPNGVVISGARVEAAETQTNAVINSGTNEACDYTSPSVPIGIYTQLIKKDGFHSAVMTRLTVDA